METQIQTNRIKSQLNDIGLFITIGKISNEYFGKSSSWLYNKINGVDGNGGVGGFTEGEKERFKNALIDLSERIRRTAEEI